MSAAAEEAVVDPAARAEALQAELDALKAKTNNWKSSVKTQLQDASTKNANLRAELTAMTEARDKAAAETRLTLNQEFKERTILKDEEIASLTERVSELQQTHAGALEEASEAQKASLERQAKQLGVDHERALSEAAASRRLETADLEKRVAEAEQKLSSATHEAAVQATKVSALERQLAAAKEAAGAAEQHQVESAERAELQAQLDAANAEIQQLQRANRDFEESAAQRLSGDQRRHDDALAEVNRRDEQLLVLQTLLKAAQSDVEVMQGAVRNAKRAEDEAVSKAARSTSRLTADLVSRMEELETTRAERDALQREVTAKAQNIRDLEEEATVRERTFDEIFASNEQRDVLVRLERDLEAAVEAKEAAESTTIDLQAKLAEALGANEALEEGLAEREKAVESKEATLAENEKRVNALAQKAQEQHRQVAALAKQATSGEGKISVAGAAAPTTNAKDPDDDVLAKLAVTGRETFTSQVSEGIEAFHHRYLHRFLPASAQRKTSSFFHRYRTFMPVIIVFVLLSSLMYWLMYGSATGISNDGSMRKYMELTEELAALKQQYHVAVQRLGKCTCPSDAVAMPVAPPPPAA